MSQNNSNNTTDPLPMLSVEERLSNLETAMTELLNGQRQILAEFGWVKSELRVIQEDAKQRYVDLRERTALNNEKISVVQLELYQLVKDLRNPTFSIANTR